MIPPLSGDSPHPHPRPLPSREREHTSSFFIEDTLCNFFQHHHAESVGIVLLECLKPVAFLSQQLTLLGAPLLGAMFPQEQVQGWQTFLSNRRRIERLIHRLEGEA